MNGITYGIPMYQAAKFDETIVDLIRCAYAERTPAELEIRRSAFWRMDGPLDEIAAAVTGARLGDPTSRTPTQSASRHATTSA